MTTLGRERERERDAHGERESDISVSVCRHVYDNKIILRISKYWAFILCI